ncbi:MAG: hypothetical protein MMC33_007824 [Icmadophila ericetorum]|nr:hypothetical protein [Icmadophila ericetorum]
MATTTSSPSDSQLSVALPDPSAAHPTTPGANTDGAINEHFHIPEFKGLSKFSRRAQRSKHNTLQINPSWEQPPESRKPYHSYVHDLIEAGWDHLRPLDRYMGVDTEDAALVISILDITDDNTSHRWPDIHDGLRLKEFMDKTSRTGVKVRLYLAEQQGDMAAGVMEALGGSLDLDPRFFQSSIHGSGHGLTASERHRAPYISLIFGLPVLSTPSRTDAEKTKVSIYILPDATGDGWTGICLFSSHTRINFSSRNLEPPPKFNEPRPAAAPRAPKTFRELYLDTFSYIDLSHAVSSPFYAVSYLLRLNYLEWSKVITNIRDEDRRINGISDTTVGHAEEIKKNASLVSRGGSTSWKGAEEKWATEVKTALEEDFKHLIEQTQLLWETRDKMAAIRQRRSEARWTTLTNTFTYVFAPITIISGIYGMNVSQISGSTSNPNIWQFFVAVVALNFFVLLSLAFSNFVHVWRKHNRRVGVKEAFGFAMGRVHLESKSH